MLKIIQTGKIRDPGEVAEWLNVAVSKTVVRANVPRVRIPLSPPTNLANPRSTHRRPRPPAKLFDKTVRKLDNGISLFDKYIIYKMRRQEPYKPP